MVKHEHRKEYNRLQEEKKKKRWFRKLFTKRGLIFWGVTISLLIIVPIILLMIDRNIFNTNIVRFNSLEYTVIDTVNGCHLIVSHKDKTIQNLIRKKYKLYDYTTSTIEKILNPGDRVIVAGAGFGYDVSVAATRVTKLGRVYAIEPREDVLQMLSASVALNQLTQVNILHALPYSSNTKILLETYTDNLQSSKILIAPSAPHQNTDRIEIYDGKKLDTLFPGLHNLKLLIINAEGAEGAVLEGAQNIIGNSPDISIIMHWDFEKMKEYINVSNIIDDLYDLDFEIWMFTNIGLQLLTKDDLLHYIGDVIITKQPI